MNLETNRLNTFTNWPSAAPVDPIRIAKAGFYYTGQGTEVQCFSCGGKISEWSYGDQVMSRHRRMEPTCDFVINPTLSGNVPLVLGRECPITAPSVLISESDEEQNNSLNTSYNYGLTEEDEMYKNDALRLLSFSNWVDSSVSRETLVSAGFYHLGGGRLRCAWCGGELAPFRNFGCLGPPLQVHRRYFPMCAHARMLETAHNADTEVTPPEIGDTSMVVSARSPNSSDSQTQSDGAVHNEALLSSGAGGTWRSLGVVGGGARHPERAGLAARLATFDRWPPDRNQQPQTLAEAGFFYAGTDDQVRCFYCDGGLGKWEASDTPWSEHAQWFPHCGYVLLVKGAEFVEACRKRQTRPTSLANVQRMSSDSGLSSRQRNSSSNFPISPGQVEECMESGEALAALCAGLDAARVRRAIVRRLRVTGVPFNSSEALIDAVLDEQLNEEAWSVTPQSQRLARDILAETLRELAPINTGIIPTLQSDERPESARSDSSCPSLNSTEISVITASDIDASTISKLTPNQRDVNTAEKDDGDTSEKKISLEEENRQLKEARLCKVCMDNEVSIVFLPCGHLVSCARCGAALGACPLCRATVRAFVRAYLA